ncbi:V-type proton ATPase proteolipid subunit 2 [Colletotrichum orchidophilum]|uniref:V-type proton ATPase proteolipid subunit 2 n=1 Tax=Colletotrichum orchidophilum TaxID=1209926 RepID=A0A1G4B5C2_9PEZI|nr:V-type proton ATPase proteolipid subunit 2 [Colletotrichum orchidophilum]OHE96629.1 V-type proton ATPase proteolipid subunit 2 [Colletotrichum orchidophilum]
MAEDSVLAPKFAPFIGMAGIAAAMIFGCIGAAYGTAKSGIGIAGVGTFRPDLIMKARRPDSISCGFMHLACGLSVGFTGLAAGYTIGIVGDKGVRSYMEQSRIFVGMVLILIFGEVLGLYGLIVALILNTKSKG